MKKVVSSIMVFILLLTCSTSQAEMKRFGIVRNDSLITGVSCVAPLEIEFYGSAGEVSYEVYYYYGSKSKPDERTVLGRPVSSGIINSSRALQIKLPYPGRYYIRSTNGVEYDNDYVLVPMTQEEYSDMFIWNNETINEYETKKYITGIVSNIGGLVLSFTVEGTASKVIAGVSALFQFEEISKEYLGEADIRTEPKLGWAWQYKFEPIQEGYNVYLLIYDEYGNLNSTTKIGSRNY